MSHISTLFRVAHSHRVLIRLALLAVGLIALGLGAAAPECYDDGGGGC